MRVFNSLIAGVNIKRISKSHSAQVIYDMQRFSVSALCKHFRPVAWTCSLAVAANGSLINSDLR